MSHSKPLLSHITPLALLLSAAIATPIGRDTQPTINIADAAVNTTYTLTVHGIVLAVILIIFGLFLVFFGSGHFRLTSFLVGFYVFGTVAWIILANAEPAGGYGTFRLTLYLVVCLVAGFIAGVILACCFHLGLWLLGAYGGFVLALWILAWSSGGVITVRWGQGLFIGLMALAGLFTSFFIEWGAIIIFTSIIGAYSFILGLDIFLDTGFMDSVQYFLNPHYPVAYVVNWRIYGLLAGGAALAILGIIIQYLKLRRFATTPAAWSSRYGRYGGRYGKRYTNRNIAAVEPADSTAEPEKSRSCWPL